MKIDQQYLEKVYRRLILLFRICTQNESVILSIDNKFDHIHLISNQYCTFSIPGVFYCDPFLPFNPVKSDFESPIIMEIYQYDKKTESSITEALLHYYRNPINLNEYVYIYGFDRSKYHFKKWRGDTDNSYGWWIPIISPKKNRYVFMEYILFIQYLLRNRNILDVLNNLVLELM